MLLSSAALVRLLGTVALVLFGLNTSVLLQRLMPPRAVTCVVEAPPAPVPPHGFVVIAPGPDRETEIRVHRFERTERDARRWHRRGAEARAPKPPLPPLPR